MAQESTTARAPSEREQRLEARANLAAQGRIPHAGAFKRTGNLAEIRAAFSEGLPVKAAGRLLTIRRMGKSVFAHLADGTDRFQIYINKAELPAEDFDAFARLDSGDHIGVAGELFLTRTGEPTIKVASWELLAKSLRPLPEKWHGLRDQEIRYRRRYLDLIANPDVRRVFDCRSSILRELRFFLWQRGFIEVETPMMQPQAGGAAARPFETHYAALNARMFLRIAPELYLKRLLVGGYDRVFELNRNFRNEGLSKTHNPEFTMLEIYEAYSDMRGMQELVQAMILHVADTVAGSRVIGEGETLVDFAPPWREVTYRDLIKETMGEGWYELSLEDARKQAQARGLDISPDWDFSAITHEIYEKLIERTLRNPTFVTRLPASLVPLAKTCPDDQSCVDVFELVIAGKEVAPGYSELADPLEQRARLEQQAGEDAQKVDEEFLEALEHGMPPAGGMGLGVDRLVMILTASDAIRDVILFPQLRPRSEAAEQAEPET